MISAGVQTCSTVLKFTADLKFTFTATEQAPPAAPVTPRCLTTHEVTGQNWSVSGGKFTLGGTPKATVKVTDCVNSSDNKGSSEDTVTTVANDGYAYTISGTSLAVSSGALAGTYIKQ